MKRPTKIIVSEIFESIQGEGITSGHPSVFLRLGGCNLLCGGKGTERDKQLHDGAEWRCDTIEVWRSGKGREIEYLADELYNHWNLRERMRNGWRLIITGGEPMMQANALSELIDTLALKFTRDGESPIRFPARQVEIETNGTIFNNFGIIFAAHGIQFNVSPKLSNSGEPLERRYFPDILKNIWRGQNICTFKFVVSDMKDFEEIETGFDFLPANLIYIMPAASDDKTLAIRSKWLVPEVMKRGYKYSSRLQVAIWNETTGV